VGWGRGWYQWEGERGGERTWEGEYSANIVYTLYINGKMISVEIILVGGREG
jgi:hypothetical protein